MFVVMIPSPVQLREHCPAGHPQGLHPYQGTSLFSEALSIFSTPQHAQDEYPRLENAFYLHCSLSRLIKNPKQITTLHSPSPASPTGAFFSVSGRQVAVPRGWVVSSGCPGCSGADPVCAQPPSQAVPCKPRPCEPLTRETGPGISALPRKAEIREFVLQFPPAGRVLQPLQSHQGCLGGLDGGTEQGL